MPWDSHDLDTIGAAEEIDLASERPDGTMRPFVTIWAVRDGDGLYVRSAYGPRNGWYRRALASGKGRVRAGGIERDVTFTPADPATGPALDRAYHTKYDRHGPAIVGTVVGPDAARVTIQVLPQD
jgi:hypothetical protein